MARLSLAALATACACATVSVSAQTTVPAVAVTLDNEDLAREQIRTMISARDIDIKGALIRLAFHDSVGTTKADGCLDSNNLDHKGLFGGDRATGNDVVGQLDDLLAPGGVLENKIGRADLWHLAAAEAIGQAGSTQPDFRWGRETTLNCDDQDVMPDSTEGIDHVMEYFNTHGGFSEDEVVALMGAHSVGRVENQNSGHVSGGWVPGNAAGNLDNGYYRDLIGVPWDQEPENNGVKVTWTHRGEVMLNTDMALGVVLGSCTRFGGGRNGGGGAGCQASRTQAKVREYAGDNNLFQSDFAGAMQKLSELGYEQSAFAEPANTPADDGGNGGNDGGSGDAGNTPADDEGGLEDPTSAGVRRHAAHALVGVAASVACALAMVVVL